MKNTKQKVIAVTLATSIFAASSTLAPRRSEAAIGVLVATMGSNPVGSVIFFVGAVGAGAGSVSFFRKAWNSSGGTAFLNYLLSAACAFGAYLLLDGPNGKSGELQSLSASEAQGLGLTQAEWQSYEQDLALVNALREEALLRTDADFRNFEIKTDADLQCVADQLRANWNVLTGGTLAPETLSAIQKMSRALVSQ
jgi:hypothetical protein